MLGNIPEVLVMRPSNSSMLAHRIWGPLLLDSSTLIEDRLRISNEVSGTPNTQCVRDVHMAC